MKRIFAFVICAVLLLTVFPIVAFAEGEETEAVEQETTLAETEAAEPIEQEPPPTESEPTEPVVQEPTLTDEIVGYIKEHLEEISVIATLILTAFYNARKNGLLNKSIGTVNNNAVTIAGNSQTAVNTALNNMEGIASNALSQMENIASVVVGYREEIEKLLTECRMNAEEKQKLEQTLSEVYKTLKASKLANVELANEVAELLVLANIPNAKKEELYARHRAAVGAIAEAEKPEVIPNDGQEAE